MKIPVNATLIEKKPVRDTEHLSIILCKIKRARHQDFVTWIYNHDMEGCVLGHYFDNLEDATKDYTERR